MKLGVTGSRKNRPKSLEQKLFSFLCQNNVTELHHGDCFGWDRQCHDICKQYGIKVIVHPPDNAVYRAFCKGELILPPKPYLERNQDIVDSVEFMIAAPDGPERQRSGTWSTVRYAKKVGVRGVVWL